METNVNSQPVAETYDLSKILGGFDSSMEIVVRKKETVKPDEESANNEMQATFNDELMVIAQRIANVETLVQELAYKDKINKELHEELQQYKTGLRKSFITPLLKTIIREYDRAEKQYMFYLQKAQESPQSELFDKLLKEFQMISLALLDLLDDYFLERFTAKEGDAYNIKEHKIVEVLPTGDAEKDGKVASCQSCGFLDTENNLLFRQAEVKVYKHINN